MKQQTSAEHASLSLGSSIESTTVESADELFAVGAQPQEDTLMRMPRVLLSEFAILVCEMQDPACRNLENRSSILVLRRNYRDFSSSIYEYCIPSAGRHVELN